MAIKVDVYFDGTIATVATDVYVLDEACQSMLDWKATPLSSFDADLTIGWTIQFCTWTCRQEMNIQEALQLSCQIYDRVIKWKICLVNVSKRQKNRLEIALSYSETSTNLTRICVLENTLITEKKNC